MEAQPKGPYVQAAMFCERVLREQDGVLSVIRIIDQVTHRVIGQNAPDSLPALPYELHALIALKPGDARGRNDYVMRMERPDGMNIEIANGAINFSGGPNQGVNMPIDLNVVFEQEGLYWFDFLIEGRLLTRMPFLVLYERTRPGTEHAR